jgi:hypothetical protein
MFEEIRGPEILIPEKPLSLRELEKRYILKVLQETGGNKRRHLKFWVLIEQPFIKYYRKRVCSFLPHSPAAV